MKTENNERAHARSDEGSLPVSLPVPDKHGHVLEFNKDNTDDATAPTPSSGKFSVGSVPPAIDCRVCTCGTMYHLPDRVESGITNGLGISVAVAIGQLRCG